VSLSRPASRISIPSLALLAFLARAAESADRKSPLDKPIAPGIQRERVSLVLVDVVVTNRRGHFLVDLRPDEFTLMVDGGAVQIQRAASVRSRFGRHEGSSRAASCRSTK